MTRNRKTERQQLRYYFSLKYHNFDFLSASVVGFIGFMGGSSANQIVDMASNEVVEESGSNILDVFFF